MEILDLAVNDFSRRSGSLLVSHAATTLGRGLEPGERIAVVDGFRCWDGVVVDLHFSLEDTLYRVELGHAMSRADLLELLARPAGAPERAIRSLG